MLFLRFLLFLVSCGFLAAAVLVVLYDVYLAFELGRVLRRRPEPAPPSPHTPGAASTESSSTTEGSPVPPLTQPPAPVVAPAFASPPLRIRRQIRWITATKLVVAAAALSLLASSIIVIPDGNAGVRVSQISGVRPGTLYPGTHLVFPLLTRVQLYDIRDRVYATASAAGQRESRELLTVEAREGLSVGVGVTVRYRIDPSRLDYIQANLPQPIEDEIVAPVVLSTFRQIGPSYVVRDVFAAKREEFRERAADAITKRLASDAIVVKEVLLRKIDLPPQYAQGLQNLLLKEQEDDQTSVDAEIEVKRVKIAEAQAEAAKVREIKRAEGDAQARVIQAKAESDSMQYTLPLKEKQIEQSRLEAEARKEATIKNAEAEAAAHVRNAEAEAQAKVIDSKAEQERRNLLADADANRIRITAKAESEKLQLEAAALRANPLLIQKIVAERLSDKVQIMMVPMDGKFFFTNDVLKALPAASEDDPPQGAGGK